MQELFSTLFSTGQFTTFSLILLVGFVYIVCSYLASAMGFGGDHGGDSSAESADTVSVFSPMVIAVFLVGFGAAGTIATYYNFDPIMSSLWGLADGFFFGGMALILMQTLSRQQASSEITTESAVGQLASVTVEIPSVGEGEVGLSIKGQYLIYPAISHGLTFPRGTQVRVKGTSGSRLIVQES